MNPKKSWWKLVAILALMSIGAGCAQQSGGLGGAALPQEAATGAEAGADSVPVVDDAAAVGVDVAQPEAGIIPTASPGNRVTMADISLDKAVRDVTKGKGIAALGLDQLRDVERALLAQIALKVGSAAAPQLSGWISIRCEWGYVMSLKGTITCRLWPPEN